MSRWNHPNQGFKKGHIVFGGYKTRFKKGQKTWNKDKKMSQKYRDNMSFAHKGQIPWNKGTHIRCGNGGFKKGTPQELHPRWKGGISKNPTEYQRKYRQRKGKQYVQSCNSKRRCLTSDLTLKIVQLTYEDNIKKYGTLTCYLCLKPIIFGKDHLEHKIPLSRGGTNIRDNLDIACQKCNNRKSNKTEEEYRKELC